MLIISVLPFIWLPVLSLADRWNYPNLLPEAWSTVHWRLLFTGISEIQNGFALSLVLSTTTAGISTIIGFWLTRSLSYSRYKRMVVVGSLLPVTMSPVLYAFILVYYFNLTNLSGSLGGVLLAQCFMCIPFAILYFQSFWTQRIRELEGLAATLGATASQRFTTVLWPVARPFLVVCFFQTFIISWFEYGLIRVIGAGQVQTLTLQVYQYVQEASPSLAALSATLLILPPACLLWINRKFVFTTIER